MNLSNMDQLRLFLVAFAAGLAVWIIVALRTGRTLWLSRTSLPRMVDRKTTPLGYWSMVVCLCALTAFMTALAVWPQISN